MRSFLFIGSLRFCAVFIFYCCSLLAHFSSCSSLESQLLIQSNYSKWEKLYMNWLTSEQKAELDDLKNQGATLDDLHTAAMKMYESAQGNTVIEANKALLPASFAFITFLTEPSTFYVEEFDRITGMASNPYTEAEQRVFVKRTSQRLADLADRLIEGIDDAEKQKLARKYMPSCVKVLISSSRMIRTMIAKYEQENCLVKDSDIEQWTSRYLNWLDKEEKVQLRSLLAEGASFDELRETVEEFYADAKGTRLMQADKSLREGCTALAEYLLGEDKAAKYIAFAKDFTNDEEKFYSQRDNLLASVEHHYRQNVARNFLDSCIDIFDASFRADERKVQQHDEI